MHKGRTRESGLEVMMVRLGAHPAPCLTQPSEEEQNRARNVMVPGEKAEGLGPACLLAGEEEKSW